VVPPGPGRILDTRTRTRLLQYAFVGITIHTTTCGVFLTLYKWRKGARLEATFNLSTNQSTRPSAHEPDGMLAVAPLLSDMKMVAVMTVSRHDYTRAQAKRDQLL